ncbi:kinase-like domain-containing protein [Pilobolus umbonatus]|nr:kinase-like domain-containing protein [Pilobolus umbonatus]
MSGPMSANLEDEGVNYEDDPVDKPYPLTLKSTSTPDNVTKFTMSKSSRSNSVATCSASEIIDQSGSHHIEEVTEVSPNERYLRLNTLLGKGAYKVVYKAIDREEGYEVAWNTIQASRSIDRKAMEHEIEILKSVRHPNIIAFHDAWYQKDEFVFVTELMTSGTLREYIRKLNLPNIKIVKRWSRQILKGLAYLHAYNPPIIHRDIKCDNIFINGAHGEVKIGDMGTAEMKMGKKYTIIGTPEFMAPEMYEEEGYNEKVDIYAFGMCLLEMVTGDYPYGECKNAAQVYKKVSSVSTSVLCVKDRGINPWYQGVKPASLSSVHSEVRRIIENCLGPEEQRMSAQEILEDNFLAVEPDVILLTADPTHVHLTLQVIFKGIDKLSVKFDFNVETDTAEEVVREMIEEQVLPERYQHHITKEINRILRDMKKPSDSEQEENSKDSIWRRENDIRTELHRTRQELEKAAEHVMEIEHKCDGYESRALAAEHKFQDAALHLKEMQENYTLMVDELINHRGSLGLKVDTSRLFSADQYPSTTIAAPKPLSSKTVYDSPPLTESPVTVSPLTPNCTREALFSKILAEYSDDTDIDFFVRDCAIATHRNAEKAQEWANKLKNQDIMTVGDLRDLHDEDWVGIGLTVFALRALKNMLKAKKQTQANNMIPSLLHNESTVHLASSTAKVTPPL